MEKILFLMALTGSALYLVERFVAALIAMTSKPTVVTKPQAAKAEPVKKEPSLETAKGSDELKTLIELLSAQNEEISKLSKVVADTSARLTALETAKVRTPRKAASKALAPAPHAEPENPATGYEGLPPVIAGGFEPVH